MSRRICFLILGTHRSGTSLLARVLATLGCDLPATLMAGNYGNEDGHFESDAIVALNNELLAALGSRWDACFPLNERWESSPIIPQFMERAKGLIDSEFGDSPLFVLKDPRICRLAPFWRAVLESKGIEVATVLPVRHPQQVADSLERRDETPHWYGHLLWLRDVLDAEMGTRGQTRVFSRYDGLLRGWRNQLAAICSPFDIVLPRLSPISANEIDLFLREPGSVQANDLLLPVFPTADDVPSWLAKVLAIFDSWGVGSENPGDYALLDRTRMDLDAFVKALGGLLNPDKNAGVAGRGAQRREELQEKLAAMDNENLRLKAELEHVNARSDDIAEREETARRMGEHLGEIEKLRADLVAMEATLASAELSIAERTEELDRLVQRAHEFEQSAHAAQADLARQATEHAAEIEQVRANVVAKDDALAAAERTIAGSTEEMDRLAQRTQEIEQYNQGLKDEISKYQAELDRLSQELADAKAQVSFSASHLRQRDEENEQYRREIECLKAEIEGEARLREKLEYADAWVFRLSGDRAAYELTIKKLEALSARLSRQVDELNDQLQREMRREPDRELDRELERERRTHQGDLAKMTGEMEAVRRRAQATLHKETSARQAAESERDRLREVAEMATERAGQAEQAVSRLEYQLSQRFGETAQLTRIVFEKDEKIAEMGWLRDLHVAFSQRPFWWFLLPAKWRNQREHRMLKRANLFDAAVYLRHYPDVAEEGMDPIRHFVMHGMAEGRKRDFS